MNRIMMFGRRIKYNKGKMDTIIEHTDFVCIASTSQCTGMFAHLLVSKHSFAIAFTQRHSHDKPTKWGEWRRQKLYKQQNDWNLKRVYMICTVNATLKTTTIKWMCENKKYERPRLTLKWQKFSSGKVNTSIFIKFIHLFGCCMCLCASYFSGPFTTIDERCYVCLFICSLWCGKHPATLVDSFAHSFIRSAHNVSRWMWISR